MRLDEKRLNGERTYITHFDSISDLVSYCKSKSDLDANSIFKELSSQVAGNTDFSGTYRFDDALKLITSGWTSGSEELTKALNIANKKKESKEVSRMIYDIVGFQASVPRYLQGVPQNMMNKRTVKQTKRTVTLIKSISYSARIRPKQILDDSVKFLQLVQAIEKQGIGVNIYTHFQSYERFEQIKITTKIKSSSERLNISKISFPLLHPAFLRRLMFKVIECESRLTERYFYPGYGIPASHSQSLEGIDKKKGEYFIPVMVSDYEVKRIVNEVAH